jgi:hypothetical protein
MGVGVVAGLLRVGLIVLSQKVTGDGI